MRFNSLAQPSPDQSNPLKKALDAFAFVPESWARWALMPSTAAKRVLRDWLLWD